MAISRYAYAKILARRLRYRNRTSAPFLSSDAFRKLANISIRMETDIEQALDSLNEKSVVFCTSELVDKFLSSLGYSQSGKILIAGDSDLDFTIELPLSTRAFQKIYLQNSLISDNNLIFTLPIGVENVRLGGEIGLPRNLQSGKVWTERKRMVLNGPYSISYDGRRDLNNSIVYSNKFFTNVLDFVTPKEYASLVGEHRFVICPRGNGKDTHRFWEALYRGAIPIVLKDSWSLSLSILGIPFLGVNDFQPKTILDSVSSALINRDFDDFRPSSIESLWISYWANLFSK